MILNNTIQNIIIEGEQNDVSEMKISENKEVQNFMIKFLTETGYKRGIESTVREIYCNSLDAMVAAGKKDSHVFVRLIQESYNNYYFEVEDTGISLSPEEFDLYIMSIGESSKRKSNDYIGCFGAGAKSFLSVADSASMICRKNGIETKYLIYKGQKRPEKDVIYTIETTEPDGVKTTIPVNHYGKYKWIEAIKSQLCYFPNIVYEVNDVNLNDFKIYENELFQWNSNYPKDRLHISLNGVPYPLDWDSLGIAQIYVPIGIKIKLDEGVSFIFNREELNWTDHTINLIKNKIKTISEWFVSKYNENIKEFNSLKKAWEFINVKNKYVTLGNKQFEISELEKYSSVKFIEPKVKRFNLIDIKTIKHKTEWLGKGLNIIAEKKSNDNITTRTNNYRIIENLLANKGVIINSHISFSGHFKNFLKDEFKYKYFIKTTDFNPTLKWYKDVLGLEKIPKNQWREFIKEWIEIKKNFLAELIDDGTEYHISSEFETYKDDKKSSYRSTSSYVSKKLNKQKGDITLHKAIPAKYGGYKLEKEVYKIDELHKQKVSFIVFTEEEKEQCKLFAKNCHIRWEYVMATKNEIKKLPKSKKIKMFARVKERPSEAKLFRNTVTAMLFQEEINKYENITENVPREFLKNTLCDIHEAYKKLYDYCGKHGKNISNVEFKEILEKAHELGDFDLILWNEYKLLQKANTELNFLRWFKEPRTYGYNISDKEEFAKFVNDQLLVRKEMGKLTVLKEVEKPILEEIEDITN